MPILEFLKRIISSGWNIINTNSISTIQTRSLLLGTERNAMWRYQYSMNKIISIRIITEPNLKQFALLFSDSNEDWWFLLTNPYASKYHYPLLCPPVIITTSLLIVSDWRWDCMRYYNASIQLLEFETEKYGNLVRHVHVIACTLGLWYPRKNELFRILFYFNIAINYGKAYQLKAISWKEE